MARCLNCEIPGHQADECTSPALCSICLDEGHPAALCPFLLFSASIEENPSNAPYGDVAKTMTRQSNSSSSRASVALCSQKLRLLRRRGQ